MKADPRFAGKNSFIMEAYVNFMEVAGARVVAIVREEDPAITDEKLKKVNGILFPGGDGDYLAIGEHIFKTLIKENDSGNFYPLWGTCLGYENMAIFASDSGNPLTPHYID
jgi:gamma-glutamyl hydrolase